MAEKPSDVAFQMWKTFLVVAFARAQVEGWFLQPDAAMRQTSRPPETLLRFAEAMKEEGGRKFAKLAELLKAPEKAVSEVVASQSTSQSGRQEAGEAGKLLN